MSSLIKPLILVIVISLLLIPAIACSDDSDGESPEVSEWQELTAFTSEELLAPVRVPEEQFYSPWFRERPLVHTFDFITDEDWRFVLTATGDIDTRIEVYITATSTGGEGGSTGSGQNYALSSETLTVTKKPYLMGIEDLTPPRNFEVKISFESPINWTFKVEKSVMDS
ncbi:hypothetical protein ACFLW2_00140 [Chloroflexota bacterium]